MVSLIWIDFSVSGGVERKYLIAIKGIMSSGFCYTNAVVVYVLLIYLRSLIVVWSFIKALCCRVLENNFVIYIPLLLFRALERLLITLNNDLIRDNVSTRTPVAIRNRTLSREFIFLFRYFNYDFSPIAAIRKVEGIGEKWVITFCWRRSVYAAFTSMVS